MIQLPAFVQEVPAPIKTEQRASVRQSCSLEAISCPLDAPESLCWGATVQNISAGGIGLLLCYPFKLGTYLAISLQAPDNRRTLLGRVVHVEDLSDGKWFLGCEFVEQLHVSQVLRTKDS
jgi:c-di-GMP-binding flagellar brake protein YcgR